MAALTCEVCGSPFYSVGAAWGTSVCGNCIAARIELALSAPLLAGERKPVRRAARRDDADVRIDERRKTG